MPRTLLCCQKPPNDTIKHPTPNNKQQQVPPAAYINRYCKKEKT